MNTKIRIFIRLFIVIGIISVISACDDITEENHEGNYDVVIPSTAYSFDVSASSSENSTTVYVLPHFTENLDSLGLSVKELKYYIDNELVSTKTSAPYNLEYTTGVMANGTHAFRADFTVGGEGFNDGSASYSGTFNVNSNSSSSTSAVFDIDFDHFIRQGGTVNFTVTLADTYNIGYKIDEINIYYASTLVGTGYSSPYTVSYTPPSNEAEVGKSYSVQVEIKYHVGDSSSSISYYSYSSDVTVISGTETEKYVLPGFNYDSHFKNGDIITANAQLYKADGDTNSYEINFYWDDDLIGSSTAFPYNFSYTIRNASRGIHKLKYEWVTYDKDGNLTKRSSSSSTITIDG